MRMNAHASSRFIGMMLLAGLAHGAGAADLDPLPPGPTTVSLPAFLDAARLADWQDAWRAHFAAARATADPEGAAITEARQTLSRAAQVSEEAAAVRARAEELSRRFAPPGESTATAAVETVSAGASDAVLTPAVATMEAPSGEPAVIGDAAEPSADAAPAPMVQQAKASTADMAPASMLGGPRAEGVAAGSAADAAPVIEDMATNGPRRQLKPMEVNPPPARRVTAQATAKSSGGIFGLFSNWGSSSEEEVATQPDDPDNNPMLPREIRSFGWNAQP